MIVYFAGYGTAMLDVIENRLFSYYHHIPLMEKIWAEKEENQDITEDEEKEQENDK